MRRLLLVDVGLASVTALAVAACGSSPTPSRHAPSSPGPAVVEGVSVRTLERALLGNAAPPRPTAAACRALSRAERAAQPFGRTRDPLLTCRLTGAGTPASYAVEVLPNGCFVAERRPAGRAIYGCGVKRA